jgi:glycosyltransferase involved in cell wall biosynthesis
MSSSQIVSILIPFRNEEKFIENCIDSILNNDYPQEKIEIFLIDGMSTDNSKDIIKKYVEKFSNIFLLENPKLIFPAAVNTGFKASKGELIVILGSHATYSKNYISLCVENSNKYDADNVGGILETIGLNTSIIGTAINCVLSSSFGVGNSTFRTGTNKVTEVDTVFGGCYKRKVFENIGLFNENLRSTSDMDFNVRLKKSGGKIILDPEIKATYFTRNYFGKFMRNNFRNGYWAIYPLRFLDYLPVSLRHMMPLFFVCGVIGGIILSFLSKFFLIIFLSVIAIYMIAAFVASFTFAKKGIFNIILMPFLFLALHLTYGTGSLLAGIKVLFYKIFSSSKKQKV